MGAGQGPGGSIAQRNVILLQQAIGNDAVARSIQSGLNRSQPAAVLPQQPAGLLMAVIEPPDLLEQLSKAPPAGPASREASFQSEHTLAAHPSALTPAWGNRAAAAQQGTAWGAQATPGATPTDTPGWGALPTFPAIARPALGSWGIGPLRAGAGEAPTALQAIATPVVKPLADVQNVGTFNPLRLGVTTPPTKFVAPDFDFNTSKIKSKTGKDQWFANPKLIATAYEGDNICYYIDAGLHKTGLTLKVAGKMRPVYVNMSKAMSTLDHDAELEHVNDIKFAHEISLKEAQSVLDTHIIGQKFGPKPAEADAQTMVLGTIKAKLVHPGLGNDKSKWAGTYQTLYNLTGQRDTKSWHSFGVANATLNPAGDVIIDVDAGTTKINVVDSKTLIKY